MTPSRGFSLIEVTISIFLIGVMLIMLQAVTRSGVLVRTSKFQGIALTIARNEIESLRSNGYAALPSGNTFSDTLMSTLPAFATTTLSVSGFNSKTKKVTVAVIWQDPGSTASSTVSLSTLITQTGALP